MSKSNLYIQLVSKNKAIRTRLARRSFEFFCKIYFPDHLKFRFAGFQEEMIKYAQDKSRNNMIVTAFRGSGKSTILNLMYTIWSIMGVHGMKSICIVSRNQDQARRHFMNIKQELESNDLLRSDLGPFQDESALWNAQSLILTRYGARITALSMEQSIRGIKHGSHRPDLIICDDLEDTVSVKTEKERENTYNFFKSELILSGDENTRVIVLGNLLHEDSLIMRLKKEILSGWLGGYYHEYPFLDDNGRCLWPEKFPTENAVDAEKKRVGSGRIWDREMLLKIVPSGTQIVEHQWLRYYDGPFAEKIGDRTYQYTLIGVDLAISTNDSADYTAIVIGDVYSGPRLSPQVLIRSFPINKRMEFPATMKAIEEVICNVRKERRIVRYVFIEDVAYQKAAIQYLEKNHGKIIKGIHIIGDKASRLSNAALAIQQSSVLFPKVGVDTLIHQLTGFGTEKHDDLADAFSLLINQFLEMKHSTPGMTTGNLHYVRDPRHTDKEDEEVRKQYYIELQRKLDNGEIRI